MAPDPEASSMPGWTHGALNDRAGLPFWRGRYRGEGTLRVLSCEGFRGERVRGAGLSSVGGDGT